MLVEVVREQRHENLEMPELSYILVEAVDCVGTKAVDLFMAQQEVEEADLQF